MKNLFLILFCFFTLCLVTHSAKADLINYNYSLAADNTLTTSYSWATVDTFDSDRPDWTYEGYGKIRKHSVANRYTAPYNISIMDAPDSTKYYTVPEKLADGFIADVSFGGNSYIYLGLFWGSVDTYNKIEFYMDESLVASYTGSDILSPNPVNGNQSAPSTNLYVNFCDMSEFNRVRFISPDYAFEFDNLAVGTTHMPVPGPVILGLIGLGLAGKKLRKFA